MSTGFNYKNTLGQWTDICNNMTFKTLVGPTNTTTYKFKIGATYYDLADQYIINTTSNTTNTPLSFYTKFGGLNTDLGYLFNPPIKFTLTTATSSNIISASPYYSVLGTTSNTTASFSVQNGPIDITIMMIGPGGNGGSTTSTIYGASGGSGGQFYFSKITLNTGSYTATAGCPGTDTTFKDSLGNCITAYKGNNGTQITSTTTTTLTLGNSTKSNPITGGFTEVGTSQTMVYTTGYLTGGSDANGSNSYRHGGG